MSECNWCGAWCPDDRETGRDPAELCPTCQAEAEDESPYGLEEDDDVEQ